MKKFFESSWLILYLNVALFFYAMTQAVKFLMTYQNPFTQFLKSFFAKVSFLYTNTQPSLSSWRNWLIILFILIVAGLLVKFWRLTFVLLELMALFLLVDFIYLFIRHTIGLEQIFIVIVMLASLINIWKNSKILHLL